MNFIEAIIECKKGKYIKRINWTGTYNLISINKYNELYMCGFGHYIPKYEDIVSIDWEVEE